MKKQIKELRVKIDGIAQLTKTLIIPNRVTLEDIPNGMTIDAFAEEFKRTGIALLHSDTGSSQRHDFFDNSCVGKAHESLLMAKAWLGQMLKEMGNESPYKNNGKRKTEKDIEPAADVASKTTDFPLAKEEWPDEDHTLNISRVEQVDLLRERIQDVIDVRCFEAKEIQPYRGTMSMVGKHLREARFYLGFELQRIKEDYEKKEK